METIQESLPDKSMPAEPLAAAAAAAVAIAMTAPVRAPIPTRASLPPKGACWYCDKPVDSVRRFCGKPCADSFDEEAEYTR